MSSRKRKILLDDSKGIEIQSQCATCTSITRHDIVHSIKEELIDAQWSEDDDNNMAPIKNHQIIECKGCGTFSFRYTYAWRLVSWDEEHNTPVYDEYVKLYPEPVSGRKSLSDLNFAPRQIRELYQEVLTAHNNGSSVLTGIGLRALIEAICKDRNANGGNLEKRIDTLVDLGFLAPHSANQLQSLRLIGNESAHEIIRHKKEDLYLAFSIIEHLISSIYILPEQSIKLPQRMDRGDKK